jgi:hypothetical protein
LHLSVFAFRKRTYLEVAKNIPVVDVALFEDSIGQIIREDNVDISDCQHAIGSNAPNGHANAISDAHPPVNLKALIDDLGAVPTRLFLLSAERHRREEQNN